MAEWAGKTAIIYASTGAPINITSAQSMTRINNNKWQITSTVFRRLFPSVYPTLEYQPSGGSYSDIAYQAVSWPEGVFYFVGAGYAGTGNMRLKVTSPPAQYTTISKIAYAHAYTLERGAVLHEANIFDSTHKRRSVGARYSSGTLSNWEFGEVWLLSRYTGGIPVLIEFWPQGTATNAQSIYGIIDSHQLQAAADSLQDMVVSFQGTGGFDLARPGTTLYY